MSVRHSRDIFLRARAFAAGEPHIERGRGLAPYKGGGVPSWVDSQLFDADYEAGRFFFGGRSYADETAFNTAVGLTKSGITRVTATPYIDPDLTNILTNGDFDTDVSGWSGANGGVIAAVSGELELTASGSLNGFAQAVSGIVGRAFRLRGTGRRGTSGNSFAFRNGVIANLTNGADVGSGISSSSPTTVEGELSGNSDPAYVGARNASASGSGTGLFNALSLVEVWPFPGWEHNSIGLAIKATAPAAAVADQVLFQLDANTERDRIRVVRQVSNDHIVVIATSNNIAYATLDLGAAADGATFEVAISAAQNDFRASLDGGLPVADVSGTLSGFSRLRVGRSLTGDTWTGSIERVTVF